MRESTVGDASSFSAALDGDFQTRAACFCSSPCCSPCNDCAHDKLGCLICISDSSTLNATVNEALTHGACPRLQHAPPQPGQCRSRWVPEETATSACDLNPADDGRERAQRLRSGRPGHTQGGTPQSATQSQDSALWGARASPWHQDPDPHGAAGRCACVILGSISSSCCGS